MKKVIFILAFAGFAVAGFSQAVVDNALIPISITLNSILRMNVTSGGNIDFAVNTIAQYENGIDNTERYQTKFTVASSTDFWVQLYAEDDYFYGSDDVNNTMDLNYVCYQLTSDGSNTVAGGFNTLAPAGGWQALTKSDAAVNVVSPGANHNAGDISANSFTIFWELGTQNDRNATGGATTTLKQGNFASDRYATNVFLVLSATAP